MKGKVQTVLGPVDPDTIGCTLTHEHLLHGLDKKVFKQPLPKLVEQNAKHQNFSLENLCWIRQYPYCFADNLEFSDESVSHAVYEEMKFFKSVGGGTIVENSSIGLRTKDQHHFLKLLSQETDVKIVAGTGYYVADSHSSATQKLQRETIEKTIKEELLNGMDGSDVKCGVIGEIGCSWPLLPFEKNVLVSSAAVQEETHCPVIIHPGRNRDAPEEIVRIFQEAGGRLSQTVMSHLDRTFCSKEEFAEFAALGCFCELDLFGIEVSHYQINQDVDMPSDAQRISFLRYLIEQGFEDKIVVSHDIHTKHRLMKFGGHGYSHILTNVVPIMLKRNINKDMIDKILIHNPKEWLTFQ